LQVAGVDVARAGAQVRRHVGVVSAATPPFGRQTAREMAITQGRLYGLSRPAAEAALGVVAELIALDGVLDQRVCDCSQADRRRLDLASAVLHRPAVLLVDDPTAGLGDAGCHLVSSAIRALNAELDTTVLFVTAAPGDI